MPTPNRKPKHLLQQPWVEVLKSRVVLVTVLALSVSTAAGHAADSEGSGSFGDVAVGYWAGGEVGWGVANGLTWGVGGGRFSLDGGAGMCRTAVV